MCPKANSALTLVLMQEIDRAFTEWPFLGVRQMRDYLVCWAIAWAENAFGVLCA